MTHHGGATGTTRSTIERDYGIAPPGYRLPDDTQLGRVVLQVASLDRSIAYYEQVLGLAVIERAGATATLGARGSHDVIVELRERHGAIPIPRRGRIGLYHFAVLLPDRASLARFVAHLGEIGAYAGMSDHLVSEAVYLTDPDGLGIEVYADRPRSTWQHEARQLTMATAPLDVPDLLREAGDETWSGAPVGTRLGHVHLYVDDLDRAASFYHQALGFDKVVWNYPGALFLSAGGYHHHLGTNTWAKGSPVATDDDARLVEWQIVLPDADDVRSAAVSIKASGFETSRDGNSVVVRDPWGTRVRLVTSA
jgi:catechol 2,3-dioxygenase